MIRIRSCEGFGEMEACVQLQVETWGYDETDLIPRKTFMLAGKIGGQVIGAFEGEDPLRIPGSWWVSPCLCRESRAAEMRMSRAGAHRDPTCTRTCSR